MNRIILLAGIAILTACGTSKKNSEEFEDAVISWGGVTQETGDVEIDPEYGKMPVYRASRTVLTDLVHTKLEVSFDWAKSQMNGVATITAKPHFYTSDKLALDAKGMEIKTVSLGGKPLEYTYDGLKLDIQLDKAYTRADKYTLVIDYVARPNERTTAGSAAITSDKGLYFINPENAAKDDMPQIWTQGETEANSVWFPTIDSPNSKSTQEIYITVDEKYTTLSNGKLISSAKKPNGMRTDHWKQDLPHSTYLFMMGVGEFKVVKDSYTRPDGTKMEVSYYVEPEWEQYAKAIFGETPEMIRFFSQLTGVEYPWDKYHQIVVRDYVSGAMENTGAVIFGDFVYKTDRELLDDNDRSTVAHELFHHWFGDLVTCESWSNLPLNESFANYSQYLWDEHRDGLDEADFNAEAEAEGYYQSALAGGYHDLIWFNYDDKEQMFDGHSYNKGGRILHMLRNYLGDEAFFAGIKNYLTTNKFKAAEFHQLRIAFEEVCGEDLNWFFNQWFLGSAHPELVVSQSMAEDNQSVELVVYQGQDLSVTPLFKLPVQVAVHDDAGEHIHKVVIDGVENRFSFPVTGTLKTVIFDNQHMLLATIQEDKPQEQFIYQFYHGKRYAARKDAMIYGAQEDTPAGHQLILDALKDPFWNIKFMAIEKASLLKGDEKAAAVILIKGLAVNDPNSVVRASAVTFLADVLGAAELENLLLQKIDTDRSYTVVGAALTELSTSNVPLAMQKAKVLEKEPSSRMKTGVAKLYGSQGGPEQFPFFEDLMTNTKLQGYDAIYALNAFILYISHQEIDLQEKALPLLRAQYEKGSYYTKIFMPKRANELAMFMDSKIAQLNEELEAQEKNKDVALADQTRKKIKRYEALTKDLKDFVTQLDAQTQH
jgi:aminopeptidase N